jgi:transposase
MAVYLYQLASSQSYMAVGRLVNIHSKTVERIVLAESERLADLTTRYAQMRWLGIDEQSHRKGRNSYFCVLTDLERGIIIDILPSRLKADLIKHFQGLGTEWCAQITAVSCDCWEAYIGAAETCFPNAYVSLDRFHVVKLLNKCLDGFRKELRKEHSDNSHFKKLKWVLAKQYHNLTDEQIDLLDAAFKESPELQVIYAKREGFHHILDNAPNVDTAMEQLLQWQNSLVCEGITAFDTFTKLLDTKRRLVANYVTDLLTNAVTEGLNNLIRSVRRFSFGMTNFHNLRWRVLAIST